MDNLILENSKLKEELAIYKIAYELISDYAHKLERKIQISEEERERMDKAIIDVVKIKNILPQSIVKYL